jgi:hypothetical protein
MSNLLYNSNGRIYNNSYCEIYIPTTYFDTAGFATNNGSTIETLGLLYIQEFKNGAPQGIKLLNIPTILTINIYETSETAITIHGLTIDVLSCNYVKDSFMFFEYITQGREVAELFLRYMMNGKLPKTLDYAKIADIWWKNLELANISFNVPSKIYESIIASIYRNPNDVKQRFGEYYGKSPFISGYRYKTGNIRDIVENLSTFSGLVYEDINRMITSGINNTIEGVEEPVSPLEKIIRY